MNGKLLIDILDRKYTKHTYDITSLEIALSIPQVARASYSIVTNIYLENRVV